MHQARAHDARLERHVNGASLKAPLPQLARGGLHGQKLGMACRVFGDFTQVARRRHKLGLRQAITARREVDGVVHNNGADGHLAQRIGTFRLFKGKFHVARIVQAGAYPAVCRLMHVKSHTPHYMVFFLLLCFGWPKTHASLARSAQAQTYEGGVRAQSNTALPAKRFRYGKRFSINSMRGRPPSTGAQHKEDWLSG